MTTIFKSELRWTVITFTALEKGSSKPSAKKMDNGLFSTEIGGKLLIGVKDFKPMDIIPFIFWEKEIIFSILTTWEVPMRWMLSNPLIQANTLLLIKLLEESLTSDFSLANKVLRLLSKNSISIQADHKFLHSGV